MMSPKSLFNCETISLGLRATVMLPTTYRSYGLINGSKCRLLVVVVNSSVSMQYVNAVFLRRSAVAAVDAVIWTIVPLARKLQQCLCKRREQTNK